MAAVEIVRIAAGGDGVGKLADGLTVFVPRTAPGDQVELATLERHKRFARGTAGPILHPSADRVDPPCRHYLRDRCGGCQLQHLSLGAQEQSKRAIVGDALRRIGGLAVDDPQIEPATEPFGYRNKITLGSDPSGRRIGYHQFDRPERIFDLEQCEIAAPDLMELWRAIRPLRHLLPMPLERLVLRRDRQGHRHLVAAGRRAEAWTRAQRLGSALAEQGIDATIWWQPPGGAVRVVGGSREVPAAPIFEQVNTEMGDRIREFTVGALDLVPGQVVWDLYAGAGQTTRLLVDRGGKVESIELDRHAVELAERSGPAPGVRRLVGRAEDLVTELAPPDAVVANPPRAGLALPVVEAIGRASPARLGYISCDPATLSRDLARLASVWPARLVMVRAFDLFPQTAHVETVAILERP